MQAQYWINERMQKLDDEAYQGSQDLQSKLKLLQKHQVFEAEILAHETNIQTVIQVMNYQGFSAMIAVSAVSKVYQG